MCVSVFIQNESNQNMVIGCGYSRSLTPICQCDLIYAVKRGCSHSIHLRLLIQQCTTCCEEESKKRVKSKPEIANCIRITQ